MDDFREWLSDNLRYFELGGAILLVVLLIFFGVRSCLKPSGSNGSQTETTGGTQTTQIVDEGTETEADAGDPLTEAPEEISTVIRSYYQALSDKNVDGVRAVVNELSPTDEPLITNSGFENYQVDRIYIKNGMTDSSKFVFVTYSYQVNGISSSVPAASSLYVQQDGGTWKIDTSAASDSEIISFMNTQMSDPQIQEIVSQVTSDYNSVLASSPELSAYLGGIGETVTAEQQSSQETSDTEQDDGARVMATTTVNIRDMAGGDDSEVIGQLDEGEVVKKLGTEGEWTMIEYDGQTAYVFSEYLENVSY